MSAYYYDTDFIKDVSEILVKRFAGAYEFMDTANKNIVDDAVKEFVDKEIMPLAKKYADLR